MTDEIRTARLLLRRWREEDREPFAALNADLDVMRFFPTPLEREQSDALVEHIEAHIDEHGYGLWALEADGKFAGFVGVHWTVLDRPDPELEVGCGSRAGPGVTAGRPRPAPLPSDGASRRSIEWSVSRRSSTSRPGG